MTASRESLRSYLLGGRDRIYNNENRTSTTRLTLTNPIDDIANRSERTLRDAQKRMEEDMRVTSVDLTDLDWAPEGEYETGYYKNVLKRDYKK